MDWLVLIMVPSFLSPLSTGGLLLDEDFSCAVMGCNSSGGITNYSYWRYSTTGSKQGSIGIGEAQGGVTRQSSPLLSGLMPAS